MTIYIDASQQSKVSSEKVRIKDVGQVYCQDNSLQKEIEKISIYEFPLKSKHVTFRKVIPVLDIIKLIVERHPEIEVISIGQTSTLVGFNKQRKPSKTIEIAKIVLVCILVFFGAAFTIMAFNNDISIQGVFDLFYKQVTGTEKPKISELEIGYSLGLTVGIVAFFNHIGKKRITNDMTPIEVEINKHKKDICEAMMDCAKEENQ